MRFKSFIIIIGLIVFLQGCNTFRGAKEGFKEDWKKLGEVDDWMKEHMW